DATVEIGDRVQIQANSEARIRTVTLTEGQHDPDFAQISVDHPSGAALLGAEEEDEIEFEIDGKPHRWMVVHVEKGHQHELV
ncbi:MAG: GreA/GreB family elongation factor, partial [Terriglobia bacterium]